MRGAGRRWVLAINTAGFALYVLWLAGRRRHIFFDPEGAVELLPCLAFLFVFAGLAVGDRERGGTAAGD
ncbi:MAG: hypothetical protein N2652_01725 [Kiritimatiellae bacterium]|nr:hypothetical protein [Kiritimatiellia bacterium]